MSEYMLGVNLENFISLKKAFSQIQGVDYDNEYLKEAILYFNEVTKDMIDMQKLDKQCLLLDESESMIHFVSENASLYIPMENCLDFAQATLLNSCVTHKKEFDVLRESTFKNALESMLSKYMELEKKLKLDSNDMQESKNIELILTDHINSLSLNIMQGNLNVTNALAKLQTEVSGFYDIYNDDLKFINIDTLNMKETLYKLSLTFCDDISLFFHRASDISEKFAKKSFEVAKKFKENSKKFKKILLDKLK
ncbi:hypothetical protein AB837_00460 [bacterium AB1]|nr:hypothetical protein AB837_00460 [bacterium AB1]